MSSISHNRFPVLCSMEDYFSTSPRIDQLDFDNQIHQTQYQALHNSLATNPASDYFYARSLSDGSASASSEAYTQDLHDGRRKDKKDKRRAQNRVAQRAYRERKEQIRQELEVKVKLWQEKHQALRESYDEQAQEVDRLKGHIERLHKQLSAMRDTSESDECLSNEFDMWPYVQWQELDGLGEHSSS